MALLSLMSCGGNSSIGGGPTGTTITASFSGSTADPSGATLPSAVAYQVGTTGTFQTLPLTGPTVSFTLPPETDAYGFAYICPTFLDGYYYSNTSIIQATTADTTSLSVACPSQSGFVNATFDASAIPGTTSVILTAGEYSTQAYQASGAAGLAGIPGGTADVALEALGANGVLALQIQRGVNLSVTPTTVIAFPPLTPADDLGTSAPVTLTGVPTSAFFSGFAATYNTANGLSLVLPNALNGIPQTTYPTVPASQSQSGDFYLIQAGADLPTQYITAEQSTNTTTTALTVALPSPLGSVPTPTPAAFPTFQANTSGFTVPGTVVDSAWIQYQTTPSPASTFYKLYVYVTQSWLGANTTLTIPDLSTLPVFAPAPPSGGEEFWTVYSTAGEPLQLQSNPQQQSGVQTLTSPMSVQILQYSGAFVTP